jgi:hypothetical protein
MSSGSLVVANGEGDVFGVDPASGRQSWGGQGRQQRSSRPLGERHATVYVAPTGCIEVEAVGKIYYYRMNAMTHEPQSTGSVC